MSRESLSSGRLTAAGHPYTGCCPLQR